MDDKMKVRHPEITVELSGTDGNAFSIISKVKQAMRKANIPRVEQAAFAKDAMSGDYDNVLATCFRWVTVN